MRMLSALQLGPGTGRLMAAPAAPGAPILTGVVAYVEVWSANGTENYSKTFTNQLVDMGAKVSKTLNKHVTHVVFKDGYPSTWERARRTGAKLVSVLWVEKCRTAGVHVDEALFPAADTTKHLPGLVRRKRKCMQPKDFIPKTPENDKRLQRKFEKMADELRRQKTSLDEVLLFESNGSLMYSPSGTAGGGHHLVMEKRLQEMKDRRENLSPTSSQVTEMSCDGQASSPCGASVNTSCDALCSDDSFAGDLHTSFDELCGASRGAARVASRAASAPGAPGVPTPASPGASRLSAPRESPRDRSLVRGCRRGPTGPGPTTPGPSTSGPSTPGRPQARPRPRGSLARKRWPPRSPPSPEEAPGGTDAAFDDYFSPANLRERSTGPPPSPVLGRGGLSRRERARELQRSDLSRLGRARGPGGAPSGSPASPPSPAAAQEAAGPGSPAPREPHARQGSPEEAEAGITPRGRQGDGSPPGEPAPRDGGLRLSSPGDRATEGPAEQEQQQSPPGGAPGSALGQPRSRDVPGSWREGMQDGVYPLKEPRGRGRGSKPMRTLVMTSMPSEKQNVVIQVVNRLQGFALAREVCDTTTHVLAGVPGRTLNVLLGIARGCWVLAYEWVLWSLELGHWIPEEPFELASHFPAAPVCRQERLLSAGLYRGTLFADQPSMFIAPASNPPRSKLRQLVRLCGGRVVSSPCQAGVLIGACRGQRTTTAQHLSETWILDSITQHRVCATEDYLLLQ